DGAAPAGPDHLRLCLRGRPVRHRQEARLPAGHGRARDRPVRPRARVPRVPRRPGATQEAGVIPLEEARRQILAACPPLHPRAVPLTDALGCATSVAVTADEAVPPFANTAVDGFAVRAADVAGVPSTLEIVATLPAGADPAGLRVGEGQAIRIMTGAPVPEGADAVVMVED